MKTQTYVDTTEDKARAQLKRVRAEYLLERAARGSPAVYVAGSSRYARRRLAEDRERRKARR